MTDQVMDLVAASPNFRFLAEPSIELAGDGATAEAYVYSDPDAALTRARRFGETVVKLALVRSGLPVRERQSFNLGIATLRKKGVISERVWRAFLQLRDDGNEATHGRTGDAAKAAAAVRTCFELGLWWHRTVTGREVDLAFTPPQPGASTPQLLRKVERQLTDLQAALDASLAERGRDSTPAPAITIGPAAPDRYHWRAESTVECGGVSYLVHEPVERVVADDSSWTLMQADGHSLDSRATPVRLRGVLAGGSGAAATQMVEGMTAQAAYLDKRPRAKSLPQPIARASYGPLHVAVTARPAGSTWRDAFGLDGQVLDPLIVPLAIDALLPVAEAVAALHRTGEAHRALDGESVLVTRAGRQGVLRDLGLAWWPPSRGEGGEFRAPEQRATARGRPGPPTDVFQLAALLYATCSGTRPGPGPAARLGVLLPGFPEQLDSLLGAALDPDPARRPAVTAFASGLRRGRRAWGVGAAHGH